MDAHLNPPLGGNRDRSAAITGMFIGALTLSIVSMILRMITRKFLTKSIGWDDWTIVAAVAGSTIGAGLDVPLIQNGYGRHRYYLSEDKYREFKKLGYIEWVQTFLTLMLLKISICLLLLRIVVKKNIVKPIQALIGVLVLSHVILVLVWIFQCVPTDAAWNSTKQGKCFSDGQLERIIIAQAIISIVSDFILASFPILILRKVQISFRTKVTCCVLMGLGLITAAACIVRTILNGQNVSRDETWVEVVNFMWRTVEINVGICAACIPTLLPLWRWLRGIRITHVSKTPSGRSDPSVGSSPAFEPYQIAVPAKARGQTVSENLVLPLQSFASENRSRSDGEDNSGSVDLENGLGKGRSEAVIQHVDDRF